VTPTWPSRLLATHPRQPDQRSCGASVLVIERALRDDDYARFLVTGRHPATGFERLGHLGDRFREEVLGMHRRTTGPVAVTGRLQLPWPRALGTPPWAVAGQLSQPGRARVVRWAWRRRALLDLIDAQVAVGTTVPLYVGSRWLPRHVVLVTRADDETLECYEPGRGRLVRLTRQSFIDGTLGLAGWTRPWCAVLPRA